MRYRRAFLPGGSFFFTVVTEKRHPLFLPSAVVEVLRMAFRAMQTTRPFEVEAMVVLPDHLHCIWTLSPGDADFATRWRLVKTWFSKHGAIRPFVWRRIRRGPRNGNRWYGQTGIGNICCGTKPSSSGMWSIFMTIRSNTGWCHPRYDGLTPAFVAMEGGMYPGDWGSGPMDFDRVGYE